MVKLTICFDEPDSEPPHLTFSERGEQIDALKSQLENDGVKVVPILSSVEDKIGGAGIPVGLSIEASAKKISQISSLLANRLGNQPIELKLETQQQKLRFRSSSPDEFEAIKQVVKKSLKSVEAKNGITSLNVLGKAILLGAEIGMLGIVIQSLSKGNWLKTTSYVLIGLGAFAVFMPEILRWKNLLTVTGLTFLMIWLTPSLRSMATDPLTLWIVMLIAVAAGALFALTASAALLIYKYVSDYLAPRA